MIVSRLCVLVLPASTKWLIDDVIGNRHVNLLLPLVLIVMAATLIQGITSYAITQLVSKAGQRLIAELRRKVQAHIAHLPVSYYDSNKSGALVSRIMTDVEGIRNLLGTGLIEFVGGLLMAVLVLGYLLYLNWRLTAIALVIIVGFSLLLRKAFATIRPIFRERGKITAEVTGRLTESLGGVRVINGYHAEAREEEVFAAGVGRILNNILKSLTATSVLSLSATVLMGVRETPILFIASCR